MPREADTISCFGSELATTLYRKPPTDEVMQRSCLLRHAKILAPVSKKIGLGITFQGGEKLADEREERYRSKFEA